MILSCYNDEVAKQWRTGTLVLLGQDFLLELRFCFPQYSVGAVCKQPVAGETGVSYRDKSVSFSLFSCVGGKTMVKFSMMP